MSNGCRDQTTAIERSANGFLAAAAATAEQQDDDP